eukprot:595891-Alexandrium_andersonii.AAC.1
MIQELRPSVARTVLGRAPDLRRLRRQHGRGRLRWAVVQQEGGANVRHPPEARALDGTILRHKLLIRVWQQV